MDRTPEQEVEHRINQMMQMREKPDYKGYENHIKGFKEAFAAGDVRECMKLVRDHLLQQTTEPAVRDELLRRLDRIEENIAHA